MTAMGKEVIEVSALIPIKPLFSKKVQYVL